MIFIRAAGDMLKLSLKVSKPVLYSLIVIALIIAAFSVYEMGKIYGMYSWKKETRELAEAKLKGEVTKINKILTSIEQIPQNLAYVLEFSMPQKEHMEILLKAVIENNDEVFGVCIAYEPGRFEKELTYFAPYLFKKNGRIVSVDPSDSTYNYFSMDWYLIPRHLKKAVWIDPYYDEGVSGGNTIMATYAVPFYSFDGIEETMDGIVTVDMSLDWLSKIVSKINLSDGSYSILVSENGTVISAPDPKWPYNESLFSLADEKKVPALRKIGRDLQKGKTGFVNVGNMGTKSNMWAYYIPIPANKWGVLLIVPEK
jgi:hypothetical protein